MSRSPYRRGSGPRGIACPQRASIQVVPPHVPLNYHDARVDGRFRLDPLGVGNIRPELKVLPDLRVHCGRC